MNHYTLIKEIIKTCNYFKVIDKNKDYYYVEKKIIDGLEDISFVENLLTIFYQKMKLKKFQNTLNKDRLKRLLFELEKIRLELEFKGGE